MDLDHVAHLRAAVEALQTRSKASRRAALPKALWFARENPKDVAQAVIVGLTASPLALCRTLSSLSAAGSPFRTAAAEALRPIVSALACKADESDEPLDKKRAKKAVALCANLFEDWDSSRSPDDHALSHVVAHLQRKHAVFDSAFASCRAERERRDRELVDMKSGMSAEERSRVPDVDALSCSSKRLEGDVERLISEISTIFAVLGEVGVAELVGGGSDGVRDALRDVWARMHAVEKRILSAHSDACLRVRLLSTDILKEDVSPSALPKASEIMSQFRALLDRVENERSYCRALRVDVPSRDGDDADNGSSNGEDSEDPEDWEDAVVVGGSDSEGDDGDGRSTAGVAAGPFEGLSTAPAVNPGKRIVSGAEALKEVSSHASAKVHNAQVLAGLDTRPCLSAAASKRNADRASRERLKKKLGKKRKKRPLALSPERKKRGR